MRFVYFRWLFNENSLYVYAAGTKKMLLKLSTYLLVKVGDRLHGDFLAYPAPCLDSLYSCVIFASELWHPWLLLDWKVTMAYMYYYIQYKWFIFYIRNAKVVGLYYLLYIDFFVFVFTNKTFQKWTCFPLSDAQWHFRLWHHCEINIPLVTLVWQLLTPILESSILLNLN
jgi:hypothetical protein